MTPDRATEAISEEMEQRLSGRLGPLKCCLVGGHCLRPDSCGRPEVQANSKGRWVFRDCPACGKRDDHWCIADGKESPAPTNAADARIDTLTAALVEARRDIESSQLWDAIATIDQALGATDG